MKPSRFFNHTNFLYLTFIFSLLPILMADTGCQHIGKGKAYPSWLNGKHPGYSDSFYLTGVGDSDKDQTSADEKAMNNLVKQIEVQISGEDSVVQVEKTKDNETHYSIEAKSFTSAKVDIKIVGLKISERWFNEKEKRFYSFATLEREIASKGLMQDIDNGIDMANSFYHSGAEHEKNKNIISAYNNYREGFEKRTAIDQLLVRYNVINKFKGEKIEKINIAQPLSEFKDGMERTSNGIRILEVKGNKQTAFPGNPLQKELVVKVVFEGKEESYPLQGVPVKFISDSSKPKMDTQARTDKEGMAKSKVYKVEKSEESINTISAMIDVKGLNDKKTTFTYSLTETYQWDKGIINLVEQIIPAITNPDIVKVTVLDFIEGRSEKRLLLSKLLESELRTTMAKVDDITIIDTQEHGSIAGDCKKRAKDAGADMYFAGVYWCEGKNLRINAKLVNTENSTLVRTGKVVIADESLEEKCIEPAPIAENQNLESDTSYEHKIEKIVSQEKKEENFNIEIWTDKNEYRVGELSKVFFVSNRDCYLTLLDIGTSGDISILFPNIKQNNNFIRGGKIYSIPDSASDYGFMVLEPSGVERIKAIATLSPFSFRGENTRNLSLTMNNLSANTWVSDYTEFRIKGKEEENKPIRTRGFRK